MVNESSSTSITKKKLWNKVKVVLYMLRKTLAKTKLLIDLHIRLKNGKLARRAFTSFLIHRHHAAFSCRCTSKNIDTLFISPQEHTIRNRVSSSRFHQHLDDNMIERVIFEVSNDGIATIEPPPLVLPMVVSNELQVVDSPLKAKEESQVDKDAEEFIKKFYKQLKQQHITMVESPSPNHLWAQ